MKVVDIRIQAQLHMSMSVKTEIARRFLNEGIEEIAKLFDTARKRKQVTINATEYTWVNLPSDFIMIKQVADSQGYEYRNYEIDNTEIQFKDTDIYEIEYKSYPNAIQVETEEPDINRAFHYALSYYLASKERARVLGDDDNKSLDMYGKFLQGVYEAHVLLSKSEGKRRKVKAPIWGL